MYSAHIELAIRHACVQLESRAASDAATSLSASEGSFVVTLPSRAGGVMQQQELPRLSAEHVPTCLLMYNIDSICTDEQRYSVL